MNNPNTQILEDFDQESSPTIIGENVKVQGFDSWRHTQLHVHTLWKSSPAVWLPFSSSHSEPLVETSQPQSHLPPLSLHLIHHITSSLKPVFPWQLGVTQSGALCRLPEQHVDENLPKASTSHSAAAQSEQVRTPQAVHGPVHYNVLYMKFMWKSVDILSVVAGIAMMTCYNHMTWCCRLVKKKKKMDEHRSKHTKAAAWL